MVIKSPSKKPMIELASPSDSASTQSFHQTAVVTSTVPNRTIYVAGQIGFVTGSNAPLSPVFKAQVQLAFENLQKCLALHGAGFQDIVKLTYYVVDFSTERMRQRREVAETFLRDHRPPATFIPVTALMVAGVMFEVEAIAVVGIDVQSTAETSVHDNDQGTTEMN